MLIRNMNSVFRRHGRIVFGAITILIIISFVGFLTPSFTGMFGIGNPGDAVVGEAFGQKITQQELRTQLYRNLVGYAISSGLAQPTRQMEEQAAGTAFQAAAILAAAKEYGIRVTDEEITEYIMNLPSFQKDGKFDANAFKTYTANLLAAYGLPPTELDESIRSLLTQGAVEQIFLTNVFTTPSEIEIFNQQLNEKIQVLVANLNAEAFRKQVKVTDAELQNYFKTNAVRYKIPARFNGMVVIFDQAPASSFKVTAAELKKYYDANLLRYADKDGKPQTFSQVEAKVRADLVAEQAKAGALAQARQFANTAYEKIGELPKADQEQAFKSLVAKSKLKVMDTGWFTAASLKIGDLGEPDLIKQFAKVYSVPITNAVSGKNAAYVGYLVQKEESRQATYQEVAAEVKNDLISTKALELARKAARDTVLELNKIAPKDRVAAAKAMKTPVTFEVVDYSMMAPPMRQDAREITELASKLPVDGIAPVFNTQTGAIVLVVAKRTLPAAKELEAQKRLAEYVLKQVKFQNAFRGFNAWIAANCQQNANLQN